MEAENASPIYLKQMWITYLNHYVYDYFQI